MNKLKNYPERLRNYPEYCLYPDFQGGFDIDMHTFDKDGFCIICGHKKEENIRYADKSINHV